MRMHAQTGQMIVHRFSKLFDPLGIHFQQAEPVAQDSRHRGLLAANPFVYLCAHQSTSAVMSSATRRSIRCRCSMARGITRRRRSTASSCASISTMPRSVRSNGRAVHRGRKLAGLHRLNEWQRVFPRHDGRTRTHARGFRFVRTFSNCQCHTFDPCGRRSLASHHHRIRAEDNRDTTCHKCGVRASTTPEQLEIACRPPLPAMCGDCPHRESPLPFRAAIGAIVEAAFRVVRALSRRRMPFSAPCGRDRHHNIQYLSWAGFAPEKSLK